MLYFCLFNSYFFLMEYWQTSRRKIMLDHPLVMGILNVTPDSFSDGGRFHLVDDALRRAEEMIDEGADIIDIGGESTRPGSRTVAEEEELNRVLPVIEGVCKRFDAAVSVDTTKPGVARRAVDAGAEIVNDISGLRWDDEMASVAAETAAGLVLMHSRGSFEAMHSQPPVDDILFEVSADLHRAIATAREHGIDDEQIVVDVGIGFGKTQEQNLELLAKLDIIVNEFKTYPLLVGASRKSFIGKIADDLPTGERLSGSLAAAIIAAERGAKVLRVHDVAETVQALRLLGALQNV